MLNCWKNTWRMCTWFVPVTSGSIKRIAWELRDIWALYAGMEFRPIWILLQSAYAENRRQTQLENSLYGRNPTSFFAHLSHLIYSYTGENGGLQSRIHDNIFMLSRITTKNSKNGNLPQKVAIQSRYIHAGFITFHDCIFDQIHDHDRLITPFTNSR